MTGNHVSYCEKQMFLAFNVSRFPLGGYRPVVKGVVGYQLLITF